MNDSEAMVFRTKFWVWLSLLCFTGIGLIGGWISVSHIILEGGDQKSTRLLIGSLAFLVGVAWIVASVPLQVVFNMAKGSIRVSYLVRPVRTLQMDQVKKIEWRTNMYAKQPGLLLHFQDGQRLLIPPASHDSRINPIIAKMRRMISERAPSANPPGKRPSLG